MGPPLPLLHASDRAHFISGFIGAFIVGLCVVGVSYAQCGGFIWILGPIAL